MTISEAQRAQIIFLRAQGKEWAEIALQVDAHRATCMRWHTRYVREGHLQAIKQTGRPRILSPAEDAAIEAHARENGTLTADFLRVTHRHPASVWTVRRRLVAAGLVMRVPRTYERRLKDPKVIERRLKWANEQAQQTGEWWTVRVFLDESTFSTCTRNRNRVRTVRGRAGRAVRFTEISGRASRAVCGAMVGDKLLPLYFVSKKFTASQFRDVMTLLYLPVLQQMFPDGNYSFQIDNAPTHRGQDLRDWLELEPEFAARLLYQPSYSPDMNVIEHVWARMKKRLAQAQLRGQAQLDAWIIREWEETSRDAVFLRALTDSMPRRISALQESEGQITIY